MTLWVKLIFLTHPKIRQNSSGYSSFLRRDKASIILDLSSIFWEKKEATTSCPSPGLSSTLLLCSLPNIPSHSSSPWLVTLYTLLILPLRISSVPPIITSSSDTFTLSLFMDIRSSHQSLNVFIFLSLLKTKPLSFHIIPSLIFWLTFLSSSLHTKSLCFSSFYHFPFTPQLRQFGLPTSEYHCQQLNNSP